MNYMITYFLILLKRAIPFLMESISFLMESIAKFQLYDIATFSCQQISKIVALIKFSTYYYCFETTDKSYYKTDVGKFEDWYYL